MDYLTAPSLMLKPFFLRIVLFLFITITSALCSDDFKETPSEPQEITIVGPSMVFEQLLPSAVQKKLNKQLNIQLKLVPANSMMAVEALVKYQASIAIIADDFENIVDVILEIKPESMEPSDFEVVPFSNAHIVIMANPNNSVKELSKEQVAKIFKGEITNWQTVGGSDLPISIYVETGEIGIKTNFEEAFLQPKDKITEKSYSVNITDGLITGVREHDDAISYYLVLDCVAKKDSKNPFLKGVTPLRIKDKTKDNHKLYLVLRHAVKDKYEAVVEKLRELAE